ncbi:hypothetical protein B0H11DRAFT_2278403 [Mycena galericulata]|nr:hypothetical protein B0H11DRAFT_2278403 [Mycena galericulata]
MRVGQFTKAQRLHIESFLDAFTAELDRGVAPKDLTKWKQKTAAEILDSPELSDLDTTNIPRKTWFDASLLSLSVYLKRNPEASEPSRSASPSGPLFKFSSVLTGRQRFAKDNSVSINSTAAERVASTGHSSPAAVYQTVLKERWNALLDEDKKHWEELADREQGDIDRNQKEFSVKMHSALTDLSRSGLIGNAEFVLFYAFREQSSGDLDIGTVHAHSAHNQVNFGGTHSELQTNYGIPWAEFAESAIPRDPVVTDSSVIPRNPHGVPIFPSIDLNTVTPADTRLLLAEYWLHAWAYAWLPASDYPPIPWAEIAKNASAYYDTAKFSLPFPLAAPQTLDTLETTMWAEYLVRTSSLYEDSPFVFYSKHRLPGHISATDNSVVAPTPDEETEDPTAFTAGTPMPITSTSNVKSTPSTSSMDTAPVQDPRPEHPMITDPKTPTSVENNSPPPPLEEIAHDGTGTKPASHPVSPGAGVVSGLKRARAEVEDPSNTKPRKKQSNIGQGTTAPRRSARTRAPKTSTPPGPSKRQNKLTPSCRRTLGYVYSDEETDAFDDE